MPQLDQVTFFSQYFWLCFFFFTFYLFLYKSFLPKMSRILKYRKRKVELSQQGISTMGQENEKAGSSYQTLLFSGLSYSASLFDSSLKQVDSWFSQAVSKSNRNQLSGANKNYIYSLGERALSNQLALSHPFVAPPQNLLVSSLLGHTFSFPKALNKTSITGATKESNAQPKSQRSSANQKKTGASKGRFGQNLTQSPVQMSETASVPGDRGERDQSTDGSNKHPKRVPAKSGVKEEKGKKKVDKKQK